MIIENISFTKYVESRDTKGYTDTNTYKVTIRYNGKQYTTTYTCSCHHRPRNIDILDCLIMDSDNYDMYDCIEDFASEMGWDYWDYNDRKKVSEVWNQCRKTNKALHRIFSDRELHEIIDDINYRQFE